MPFAERWGAAADGRWLVPLLALLVAVRFGAATMSAFLGIEGFDTRTLDTAFELYSDTLLAILVVALAIELRTWGPSILRRASFVGFVVLAAAMLALWAGMVAPAVRLLTGPFAPWTDFIAGTSAAAGIGVLTWVLEARLSASGAPRNGLVGLRAIGFGFPVALELRSIRLLDFGFLFGWSLPSGVLWLLDFGPSLLLSAIAIGTWATAAIPHAASTRSRLLGLGLPLISAAVGFAVSLGLGGFIASNALAWGGSYTVFSPTTVSLPLVAFAVGGYLATAGLVAPRIPRAAGRLIFGGIAISAFAGIQTSTGLLTSFVGLATGIVLVGRGLSQLVAPPG